MMQTMESPHGKRADMLAVFLLESKHSSLDRILNQSEVSIISSFSQSEACIIPVTEKLLVRVQKTGDGVSVETRAKSANVKLVKGRDSLKKLECSRSQPGVVPR